jgi:hypothetical protein
MEKVFAQEVVMYLSLEKEKNNGLKLKKMKVFIILLLKKEKEEKNNRKKKKIPSNMSRNIKTKKTNKRNIKEK